MTLQVIDQLLETFTNEYLVLSKAFYFSCCVLLSDEITGIMSTVQDTSFCNFKSLSHANFGIATAPGSMNGHTKQHETDNTNESAITTTPKQETVETVKRPFVSVERRHSLTNIGRRRRSSAANQPPINFRRGTIPNQG